MFVFQVLRIDCTRAAYFVANLFIETLALEFLSGGSVDKQFIEALAVGCQALILAVLWRLLVWLSLIHI